METAISLGTSNIVQNIENFELLSISITADSNYRSFTILCRTSVTFVTKC